MDQYGRMLGKANATFQLELDLATNGGLLDPSYRIILEVWTLVCCRVFLLSYSLLSVMRDVISMCFFDVRM